MSSAGSNSPLSTYSESAAAQTLSQRHLSSHFASPVQAVPFSRYGTYLPMPTAMMMAPVNVYSNSAFGPIRRSQPFVPTPVRLKPLKSVMSRPLVSNLVCTQGAFHSVQGLQEMVPNDKNVSVRTCFLCTILYCQCVDIADCTTVSAFRFSSHQPFRPSPRQRSFSHEHQQQTQTLFDFVNSMPGGDETRQDKEDGAKQDKLSRSTTEGETAADAAGETVRGHGATEPGAQGQEGNHHIAPRPGHRASQQGYQQNRMKTVAVSSETGSTVVIKIAYRATLMAFER